MRPSLLGGGTESCGRVVACSLGRRKPRVRRGGILENPIVLSGPPGLAPPRAFCNSTSPSLASDPGDRRLDVEPRIAHGSPVCLDLFHHLFSPLRCIVPVGVRPALSNRSSAVPCAPASSSGEGCAVEDAAVRGRSSVGQCDVPLPWPCPSVCTAGPPADVKHVPIHVSSHIEDLRPSLSGPAHKSCMSLPPPPRRLLPRFVPSSSFDGGMQKKRGRWTCDDSLRRYQKPIALMKEEQSLPRWMLDRRAELEAKLARGLQGIPRRRAPLVQQRLVPR